MSRHHSVFYKLVTDENSTTQLLCNLLQFDDFRVAFLQLILPGIDLAEVKWGHIRPQIRYLNSGQPDIQIRNERVFVLIEVKVTADRDCTDQPSRYIELLREQKEPIRRLVFLVPSNWFKLDKLRQDFQTLQSVGVETSVVTWKGVMKMIEEHSHAFDQGKPFVEEFHTQVGELIEKEGHKPEDLKVEELNILGQIVDGIQSKANGFGVRRERIPFSSKYCAQYGYVDGLYFKNFERDEVFWFGVWDFFWKEEGYRLCFTVEDRWGKEVNEAFRATYKGNPKRFRASTVGVIENEVLNRPDAVSVIWSILKPIVQGIEVKRKRKEKSKIAQLANTPTAVQSPQNIAVREGLINSHLTHSKPLTWARKDIQISFGVRVMDSSSGVRGQGSSDEDHEEAAGGNFPEVSAESRWAGSYIAFRRRVRYGYGCIMLEWCGMWLGIEHDGYTHS